MAKPVRDIPNVEGGRSRRSDDRKDGARPTVAKSGTEGSGPGRAAQMTDEDLEMWTEVRVGGEESSARKSITDVFALN